MQIEKENPVREQMQQYNILWTSQSAGSKDSMPLGGCNVGCNVWVENDEVLLYLAQSGAFDENNTMLKLGRVRIAVKPNPFASSFRQELHLYEGYVSIEGQNRQAGLEMRMNLWVDVRRAVVSVDVQSSRPVEVTAQYESWRTEDRPVTREELRQCIDYNDLSGQTVCPVTTYADVVGEEKDGLLFYHRNRSDCLVSDRLFRQQKAEDIRSHFPEVLKDRTFGGILFAEGMAPAAPVEGVYAGTPYKGFPFRTPQPVCSAHLGIALHTGQTSAPEEWRAQLLTHWEQHRSDPAAFEQTRRWWAQFWEKSYVFIDRGRGDQTSRDWQAGRNYQLFRYMLGCNYFGVWPTKFNGGLFTFDTGHTPDFRAWGGGTHTTQNQRLVYWPMLKSGDFDAMPAQFDFFRRITDGREAFVRKFWHHAGACFPEQVDNFGLSSGQEYWWLNRPEGLDDGVDASPWVRYLYSNALEIALMILEYHRYTGRDIGPYMPFIRDTVLFYDEHYPLGKDGRYHLYPSTALESYKGKDFWSNEGNPAGNPTDAIAGLTCVLDTLLDLPDSVVPQADKTRYRQMQRRVPVLPVGERDGVRQILPAAEYAYNSNCELPQLYPVFPYRLYGIWSSPADLQLARDTCRAAQRNEKQKLLVSWHQQGIFAARLGMSGEARRVLRFKLGDNDSGYRFPAFWGPGHDWMPDHNWGGSGAIGLQEMLVQTHGDAIYLLPAWPEGLDVQFRLWVEGGAAVDCRYQDGAVQYRVTPQNGRRVVLCR